MNAASLWLIGAVLVQIGLVFVLAALLYRARIPLVMRGKVRVADVALDREGWPDASRQVANAFSNQFELPVVFYAAALLMLHFGATVIEVVLAWLFVASRCVHAYIHVTSNHVVRRFLAYATGAVILLLFWVVLLVRLIAAATGMP